MITTIRKILTIAIFGLGIFGLQAQSSDKLKIVTTASMLSDIASNIIIDNAEIKTIVPIGGDPHRYQPTPRDARLVQNADIIFKNGLTFEGWISELIENSGTKAPTYTVTSGIDALTSTTYKNSSDPHAWMNAENGIIYAKNIYLAMAKLDPKNTEKYKNNFDVYKSKLQELDKELKDMISEIPENQRILITSHDAFQYYGRQYGLKLEAIMGISTEAEAQTSDITRVMKSIKKYNVPAVFVESTINPKLIQQIAKDNNVEIGGELYADSLGDRKSPAATYIDMLRYNTKTIVNALKQKVDSATNREDSKEKKTQYWIYIVVGAILLGLLPLIISKIRS